MVTCDRDRLEKLTLGRIKGLWRVDSVVASTVDEANAIVRSSVFRLEEAVLHCFIRRGKDELSRASMPAEFQGRSAVVAATVAMLRLVLVGTLGTRIVKGGEAFSTNALLLTSLVVEVEGRLRLEQLTAVKSASAKEKLARIGIQDGVYRSSAHGTLRERRKTHEHGHLKHR
jgi:hypothetical protein